MSIPNVGLGFSFVHRLITRVAVTSIGLRFLRDVGARIEPGGTRTSPTANAHLESSVCRDNSPGRSE